MFIRIQAFHCLFVQDSFNEGFLGGKFCYDFQILIYAFFPRGRRPHFFTGNTQMTFGA